MNETEPAAQAFLVADAALRERTGYALLLDDGSVLLLDERMPKEYAGRSMADGSVTVWKVKGA